MLRVMRKPLRLSWPHRPRCFELDLMYVFRRSNATGGKLQFAAPGAKVELEKRNETTN